MMTWIECLADGGDGIDMQLAENIVHLLHDQFHAGAQLLSMYRRFLGPARSCRPRAEFFNARCRLHNREIEFFALGPLACIFKLGLQAGDAV